MINREYGKLDENGKIEYASSQIRVGNIFIPKPSQGQFAMVGMWKICSEVPKKEGFYYTPTEFGEYIEDSKSEFKTIKRMYDEHAIATLEPEVVRYSKLKVISAAKEAGKWEELKKFIQDSGLWDEWLVCQYLSSDHPQFEKMKKAIAKAGIASEDEIERMLSKSIDTEAF